MGYVNNDNSSKTKEFSEDSLVVPVDGFNLIEYTNTTSLILQSGGYYYSRKFYNVKSIGNDTRKLERASLKNLPVGYKMPIIYIDP